MVVVDSGVWIDFFNGAPSPARDALHELLGSGDVEICVPDLVLFEVLRGFRQEKDHRDAKRLLRSMTPADVCGESLMLAAVDHYRSLRAAGITVRSAVDVLLATFCIENDHHLLHDDRDFIAFESRRGLRSWRSAPAS